MGDISKKVKLTIVSIGLAAALNGCATVITTAAGPITGAIQLGEIAYKRHPILVFPGMLGGAIGGPFAGFVKGLIMDLGSLGGGSYDLEDIYTPFSYR